MHPNLTVIVGDNGSGKASILEGIANALSTLLVGMDGLAGLKNDKNQVSLKAFHIGSTKDVQPQYPTTVKASAVIGGKEISWARSRNEPTGSTTVRDAGDIIKMGKEFLYISVT